MTKQNKRIVVVTGGSRGIGRTICISLAAPDTDIYFNYFNPVDPAAEIAAAAETEKLVADAQSRAISKSVNIAVEKEVAGFFDEILETTGRIDVLVNNAGITKDGLLVRMKEKDWDDVLDVNLKGAFLCTKIAARGHDEPALWSYYKHIVGCGRNRQYGTGKLFGFKGRLNWAHKNNCKRTCTAWYYGQCGGPWFYRNRHDCGTFR